MAETILSKAIRGLSSSLRFSGSSTGPPGIDLSRASTPVNDLTQYARYGAALVFNQLQDGWVTATFVQTTTEAGFFAQTELWDTQVSGDFGIATNSLNAAMCWIYHISAFVSANTSLDDIGASRVTVPFSRGIGPGLNGAHLLWGNTGFLDGKNFVPTAAIAGSPINMAPANFPIPWAPGSAIETRVQQVGVNPRTTSWTWNFLCRLVPFGVPPLP